jgi:endonuclease III
MCVPLSLCADRTWGVNLAAGLRNWLASFVFSGSCGEPIWQFSSPRSRPEPHLAERGLQLRGTQLAIRERGVTRGLYTDSLFAPVFARGPSAVPYKRPLQKKPAIIGSHSGGSATAEAEDKQSFDIDIAIRRIRSAVRPFAKAALFELADLGFHSPFELLIACMISIRTRDEVTLPTAQRLFERARTPAEIGRLKPEEIDRFIHACTFHEAKARQIHTIARRVRDEYGGTLPCDLEVLLSFHGVGIKCANLVLGIACDQPHIAVDVHVHRVTNRWGYVHTSTPEQTTTALMAKLPRRYWIEINRLLVPFGKHICTGHLPHCSTCSVLDMCRQVGVRSHR